MRCPVGAGHDEQSGGVFLLLKFLELINKTARLSRESGNLIIKRCAAWVMRFTLYPK
jgi:hypothetical protein